MKAKNKSKTPDEFELLFFETIEGFLESDPVISNKLKKLKIEDKAEHIINMYSQDYAQYLLSELYQSKIVSQSYSLN